MTKGIEGITAHAQIIPSSVLQRVEPGRRLLPLAMHSSDDFLLANSDLFVTLLVSVNMTRSHIVSDFKNRTEEQLDTHASCGSQEAKAEACTQGCHLQ